MNTRFFVIKYVSTEKNKCMSRNSTNLTKNGNFEVTVSKTSNFTQNYS